ncbi:hypothetical protein ABZ509_11300, partial [Streptomyces lavendulocolor]
MRGRGGGGRAGGRTGGHRAGTGTGTDTSSTGTGTGPRSRPAWKRCTACNGPLTDADKEAVRE